MDISTVLVFIKQVMSTLMTLLMLMSPAFGGTGVPYQAEKPEEVVMSFSAVSDIHVETNNPDSYKAFYDILEGIKAGENNDAVVFTGDNVMNGQILENFFFYSAVRAAKAADETFVVSGNHDFGNGEGDFDNHLKNFLANNAFYLGNKLDKPYYYKVVKGCYMIFLSSEASSVNDYVLSDEQISWLEGLLAEAEAAKAPIFVFNHHPVNYIRAESDDVLANILNKYDNLLYIHGHTHIQLSEGSFYEWNGVKSINLPRSSEVVDYEPGDGIVVDIYETEVVVRVRNFVEGEWLDITNVYQLTK